MMIDSNKRNIENQEVINLSNLLKETNHEFNNSLTTILGFTQLLMHNEKLDESLREYVDIIYESAKDSKNIIDRAKNCKSLLNDTKMYPVRINDLVESTIKMSLIKLENVCNKRKIDIKFTRDLRATNCIQVSSSEIREVILNIILNAIDSIEEDGHINIQTRDDGDGIVLEITDTGRGMDRNTMDSLFNPYFTTKGEYGTGLGLSIAKRIIEEHNGEIEVESEREIGTKFKIYFDNTYLY